MSKLIEKANELTAKQAQVVALETVIATNPEQAPIFAGMLESLKNEISEIETELKKHEGLLVAQDVAELTLAHQEALLKSLSKYDSLKGEGIRITFDIKISKEGSITLQTVSARTPKKSTGTSSAKGSKTTWIATFADGSKREFNSGADAHLALLKDNGKIEEYNSTMFDANGVKKSINQKARVEGWIGKRFDLVSFEPVEVEAPADEVEAPAVEVEAPAKSKK